MPKLTIDKTAALCLLYQCSIEELAQAVTESMAQGDGEITIDRDWEIELSFQLLTPTNRERCLGHGV
jgi:hypothetical protein